MREMKRSFTKKIVSIIFSVLMLVTLVGCQSSSNEALFKAGTYEATVAGYDC
jgi:uncharacterized lipoprotein YehR (DUF1307 family)